MKLIRLNKSFDTNIGWIFKAGDYNLRNDVYLITSRSNSFRRLCRDKRLVLNVVKATILNRIKVKGGIK